MADTLVDYLTRWARATPAGLALADAARHMSWRELATAVERRAQDLPDREVVGLHRPADTGWVVDLLALWSRESTALAFPPGLPLEPVERECAGVGAVGVLTSAVQDSSGASPALPRPVHPTGHRYWAADLGVVHFTSGTTGARLGVLRGQRSLLAEAQRVAEALRLRPGAHVLCSTPVAHSFASGLMMAALVTGSSTLLVPTFAPEAVLRLAVRHRPRVLAGTPYVFRGLLRTATSAHHALTAVDTPIVGGISLPLDLAAEWRRRYQRDLVQEYGSSECGIVTLNLRDAARFPQSVGRPLSGLTVHVTDENGCRQPTGIVGRVLVEHPWPPTQYISGMSRPLIPRMQVNGRDATDTTDLGYLNSDGLLFLTDRRKAVINIDGLKVSPRAIEDLLCSLPSVSDAVVLGITDPYRGERVVAMVESTSMVGTDILASACRAELSPQMIPREWLVVDRLPRTATGKPDVAAVRSRFERTFDGRGITC